ncbi:phosphatidate cytidylyltransferase [Spirochaetia bacterium]|nr:phosphatidate cytidylyltransferase [Spirochaetia bacterium]
MKKIIPRLLIFFVGIPLVIFLIVFLPYKNHLAANCVIVLCAALGAVEFAGMLRQKNIVIPACEAAILGALAPLAAMLAVSFGFDYWAISGFLSAGAFWILISRIFSPDKKFDDFAGRAAAGFSIMIYPGLFMTWIIRMARWPHADLVILLFILTICINDSAAWAAGMLFGKGNRGVIPASPNKSVAGFIGGFIVSLGAGAAAVRFFPEAFTSTRLPSLAAGMILTFLAGVAGTLGDLGESVLKRSAGIKDSGSLIPGRGGMLDTIDSIALAAPVYFGVYWFLFSR